MRASEIHAAANSLYGGSLLWHSLKERFPHTRSAATAGSDESATASTNSTANRYGTRTQDSGEAA